MAFGNLDPNTDGFTTTGLVWPNDGEGGVSYQKLNQLAKNNSYNYRRVDQRLFIFNEQFGVDEEKDFDTDFDYSEDHICYFQIIAYGTTDSQSLPFDVEGTSIRYIQITTNYQAIVNGSYFDIKALATGGIRVKNERYAGTRYISFSLFEMRLIVGS